jgi:hypothetical protein
MAGHVAAAVRLGGMNLLEVEVGARCASGAGYGLCPHGTGAHSLLNSLDALPLLQQAWDPACQWRHSGASGVAARLTLLCETDSQGKRFS